MNKILFQNSFPNSLVLLNKFSGRPNLQNVLIYFQVMLVFRTLESQLEITQSMYM